MIPCIFKTNETNFKHNGLGFLPDATSCTITEERNGSWELEMQYPSDGMNFNLIKGDRWIKAKANDRQDPQLFRIYYISKPIQGVVTIKAEHYFYKLKDNFIPYVNIKGNCGAALQALNNATAFPSGFNFVSDIAMTANFNIDKKGKNFWEAIVGSKGSIIDTYGNGADIVRDNNNIAIRANAGQSNNVLIQYSKNLKGLTCEEDWTGTYTGIYPYAVDSESNIITLAEKYVYSPLVSRDPNPRILSVDFSSEFTENETITESALRKKSANYFKNRTVDRPSLKYKLDIIVLSETEEFKDQGLNEYIGLFDRVLLRHELYGIDSTIKINKIKYDTLTESILSLEAGDVSSKLGDTIKNMADEVTQNDVNKVTKGYLDKAMKELSDAITGNDGGYVRLNPPENPSELLVMDNEDLTKAQTVWRWNKSGWGVSTTGYNGTYMGLTKNGKLVVDELTTNAVNAALIKTGTLISNNGISWINLDDGSFNFGNGSLKFDSANGLSVIQGGIVLNKDGITVQDGNFAIKKGSKTVFAYSPSKGLSISQGGVTIDNDGLSIADGKFFVYDEDGELALRINDNGYIRTNKGISVYDGDEEIASLSKSGLSLSTNGNFSPELQATRDGFKIPYGDLELTGNDANLITEYLKVREDAAVKGNLDISGRAWVDGDLDVGGDLDVTGSKPCLQATQDYGKRRVTAYETAEYYFGDIGEGVFNSEGECIITIEEVFKQCVNTNISYQVFTQVYTKGSIIEGIDKYPDYFVVYGTPNANFGWEIKAKRKGWENTRLEERID